MKSRLLSRLWLGLLLMVTMPACTLNSAGVGPGAQTFSGPPVIEIIAPAPNNTYLEGVGVNIQVSISNAGADIARVEFTLDDAPLATSENPNTAGSAVFSLNQRWTAEGEGTHTAGVTAFRADGTASTPATVTFSVIGRATQEEETEEPDTDSQNVGTTTGGGQPTARATTQPTAAPTTAVPPTDAPAASATPSGPTLTVNQGIGINVRSGPSTLFQPALGGLAAGASAEIVARNPAGDWFKIVYGTGFGWVNSANVTTSGNVSDLPVDQGPPLPTAPPATAVPATAPPAVTSGSCSGTLTGSSNLCVSAVALNGGGGVGCGGPMTVLVTVGNNGGAATGTGFFVTATVTKVSDNTQVFTDTQPTSNIIPAGGTTQVTLGGNMFTHMTGGGQSFRVTITFNPNGNADSNTTDSTYSVTYTLSGAC